MCTVPWPETRLEEEPDPATVDTVHDRLMSHDCGLLASRVVLLWNYLRIDHDLVVFQLLLSSVPEGKGSRQKARVI